MCDAALLLKVNRIVACFWLSKWAALHHRVVWRQQWGRTPSLLWISCQGCLLLQKSLVFQARIYFCRSRTHNRCTGSMVHLHMHHQHGPDSTFTCALSTCPLTPGLFNYVGSPPFNPFLALSLKMERPCSPSWGKKKKSVICHGSVGRHLG